MMNFNFVRSAIAAMRACLAAEVIDNRLNPAQLAISSYGYWVQSQLLHIPDRTGFFSPGPPRLQVHEAAALVFVVFSLGSTFQLQVLIVILLQGKPFMWGTRRVPGYEWDDWKMRTE